MFLTYIESEAQRLTTIVDKLLSVAQARRGRPPARARAGRPPVARLRGRRRCARGRRRRRPRVRARAARRTAARAHRLGQAPAGALEPRRQRGALLACRGTRDDRGVEARRDDRAQRRRPGCRDSDRRAGADLLEVLPGGRRADGRHGCRPLHRAGPRQRTRWADHRSVGRGSRFELRRRAAGPRRANAWRCRWRTKRQGSGRRRRGADPPALPRQPRGGEHGGARGRRRADRPGGGAARGART